jgi:hypothetical protein
MTRALPLAAAAMLAVTLYFAVLSLGPVTKALFN